MSTFDQIAAQQGWNADSRETVLRTYISLDSDTKPASLEEFAQSVADTENAGSEPVLKVPPLQMDVVGEYTGNAYPEQHDLRLHLTDLKDERFRLWVEDSSGNEVGEVILFDEEAFGVIKVALTDHSLNVYEDDWKIPSGIERTIQWDLTFGDTQVILASGHIDEIAAWFQFATGEMEWTGGDEWEY